MLAWAALAVDAVAHPLMMSGMSHGSASMATCDGDMACEHSMSTSLSHGDHGQAPAQSPADSSHHDGSGCCASPCSVIAGVASFQLPWQSLQRTAFFAAPVEPLVVPSVPLYRPPIV
ncbi:MAG TPA: hypothetical protein VFJ15_08825 [Oleiagrimonas sp.]|nr:hypothetical protein [Oleiagrimonas sp.]